jgi:hypothetical protein
MIKKTLSVSVLVLFFFAGLQRFYGQTWDTVAAGLNANVWGMVSNPNDNLLYVAGAFSGSGTTPLSFVARWDGTAFLPAGAGFNGQAYALALYNNEVYCAGSFTSSGANTCLRIAKWDGSQWVNVGSGLDNQVFYVSTYNGELIAGGIFNLAGATPVSRIARWNGTSWNSLGTGIGGSGVPQVFSIQEYNGLLYAAGQFDLAGGVSVNNIAVWDGSSWSDVGGGVTGAGAYVNDMYVFNGELYVTGSFTDAGGVPVVSIAKWDGTSWSAVGTGLSGGSAYGNVLMEYKNELYLGGNFLAVDGTSATRIARFDGSVWQPLTTGCDQDVTAMDVYNGDLYVGGIFIQAGGLNASKIARWNIPCITTATISSTGESCPGACDGTALVSATGSAPFTYLWSTGALTDSIQNLCAGVYTVTVTDSVGCVVIDSVVVGSPPAITLSMQSNQTTCIGACNGTAEAIVTGNGPFSFVWNTSPVQNDSVATGLCAGVYEVMVTDANGCTAMDSVEVEDPAYSLSFITTDPSCPGLCDGEATVNTTSPHAPYSYVWDTNPLQTSQTITGLCAGQYVVIVTDNNACSVMDTVVINPSQYAISTSAVQTTCKQACDGEATVTTNSPFAPFTYSWNTNPVQTTATATGLCAGIYEITLTDDNGCAYIDSVEIEDPDYSLSFLTISPSCIQFCNGQASVNSTSPYAPYTYYWNTTPQQTANPATGLCAGFVTVTVTDDNGCAVTDSVEIVDPPPFALNITAVGEDCPGACNGSAAVSPASFFPPFQYFWNTNPVQNTDSVFNLCPGVYTVTVIDNEGCASVDSVEITASALELTYQITPATCNGGCDGAITVYHNGPGPYSYIWFTGDTTATISGLCPAVYFVTVSDSNGCSISGQPEIEIPQPPSITLAGTQIQCAVNCDGEITVSAAGNAPFSYLWNNGFSNATITNLCPGWYVVTVTDAGGCESTDSLLIWPVMPVDVALQSSINATCYGICDGLAQVVASGGSGGPYTYLWSFGQTTSQVVGLCAGVYTVTGFDGLGCPSNPFQVTITEPDEIILTMTPSDASCQTCNDGSITVNVTGGVLPYQYFWTPSVSNPNQLTTGWYYLCITDNNGCQTCDSAFVDYTVGVASYSHSKYRLNVFPNPMSHSATVFIPEIKSGKLIITDWSGRVISEKTVIREKQIVLERSGIVSGTYLITFITAEGNRYRTKLTVE